MRFPKVRFTIRRMMGAVAVIGLALFKAEIATLLLVLSGSVLAMRSPHAQTIGGRSTRWAIPYFVTLTCLYLPYSWVILDSHWDGYQWQWIALWPVLPGLFAGIFAHPNDHAITLISGMVTVLLICLFTRMGASGGVALVASSVLALLGSGLGSWLAFQLFHL